MHNSHLTPLPLYPPLVHAREMTNSPSPFIILTTHSTETSTLPMPQLSCHSPLGALTISEDDHKIVALDWGWGRDQEETPLLITVRDRLERYFDREAVDFSDLPFDPYGTDYQKKIWAGLLNIPYGTTRYYSDFASEYGGSARSIGGAAGANPIPILIPCHRIIGRSGLGGYSGMNGIDDKKMLLNLEQPD